MSMSRREFRSTAKPMVLADTMRGQVATVREVKPGKTLGWYAGGKAPVTLPNGSPAVAQVGCNISIVGSDEYSDTAKADMVAQLQPVMLADVLTGELAIAVPRKFKADVLEEEQTVGWTANGKVNIKLANGNYVRCQVGINITPVKSALWPV